MIANNSLEPIPKPQEQQNGWFRNWWGKNKDSVPTSVNPETMTYDNPITSDDNPSPLENEHWYQRMYQRLWNNNPATHLLSIDDDTRYSQLNIEQIDYLQDEAINCINSHRESWCWYENLSNLDESVIEKWTERNGIVSVFNTGCGRCPLPLPKYPLKMFNGYGVLMNNSILLPSNSPTEYLHELPLGTKLANTVKEYYNFPNEQHLYLKSVKAINNIIDSNSDRGKRFMIISMVGWLPERYEKLSIGEQRTAQYLSKKLSQSLNSKFDCNENSDDTTNNYANEIISLSFECPLHYKKMDKVLDECMFLLQHWENLLNDIDGIFFIGVYHSVPLLIHYCYNIIQKYSIDSKATKIGILSFESCLQGYRYWDHSVDKVLPNTTDELDAVESNINIKTTDSNIINNETSVPNATEQEYSKFEQTREKQLYYGLNKDEIEVLNIIKKYSNLESKESLAVQEKLDWLLFNCDSFRLNLISSMYDNFMTMNEKLAFDFKHPKIIRNVWCDGRYMDIDLKQPQDHSLPNFNLMTPNFQFNINIPRERRFELNLISNLLLLQNLGYHKFIPLFKLLSPYFISRSFNENTMTATLKKQKQLSLKNWLQEMDTKWFNNITINNNNDASNDGNTYRQTLNNIDILKMISDDSEIFPEQLNTVHEFIKYIIYQNHKNSDFLQIYGEIYDDDTIYDNFLDVVYYTKNPLTRKHLHMNESYTNIGGLRSIINGSILNSRNQYDLVWKFHESLCDFIQIKNLPLQDPITNLNFQFKLTPCVVVKPNAQIPTSTDNYDRNGIDPTYRTYNKQDNTSIKRVNNNQKKSIKNLSIKKTKFKKNSQESMERISNIWTTFQPWTPRTRGLIKLRDILNILKSYQTSQQLCDDL